LLGAVLGEPGLHELVYDARLERVLSHGIGFWDVLDACHRQGSLDSAIRNANPHERYALADQHRRDFVMTQPMAGHVRHDDGQRLADAVPANAC